jgi:threonine/homoserine/homoserine lactone efflux protein
MDWHIVVPFLTASLISLMTPGPVMAIVAHNTVRDGASGGVLTAIGISVAELFLLAATFAGLAMSAELLPSVFRWLSLAGALYLTWLAVAALRARQQPESGGVPPPSRRPVADGLTIALSNPTALIFYAAFFPQFIDPQRPIVDQMLVLGAIYLCAALAIDLVCVLLFARIRLPQHPRFDHFARLGSAVVYFAIAAVAVASFLTASG